MTIRTDGAQQVGDAVVAGRMLGGGELGTLHRPHQNCDSILPNSMGPPGEILSLSGYSLAESAIGIATGRIRSVPGYAPPLVRMFALSPCAIAPAAWRRWLRSAVLRRG
jgi:hypothetical protein